LAEIVIFTDVSHGGFGRYAGTYRVATELRQLGADVQIVEFFTKWDKTEISAIIDKFINSKTLFVGFSCTFLISNALKKSRLEKQSLLSNSGWEDTFGREDILDIFETIKSVSNSKIVIGGHKAGNALADPWNKFVDYVFINQSDVSISHLYKNLKYGEPLKYEQSGNVKIVRERDYQVNNFTNSRIRFTNNDLIFEGEHLPMEIARGCIFKCAFCNYPILNKKLWEFNRAPEVIGNDLKEANFLYGSEGFMFADDTYNDSVEKVQALHKEFTKLPFDLTFSTYARADILISKMHTAPLLYESGMRSVFFGIETLNHQSGKTIGKGMDPEKLKDGLYQLKQVPGWKDIITTSGFIIGLPYDTEDTIQQTLDWLSRDDCPLDSFSPTPLRLSKNSSMGMDLEKYGYWFDEHGKWHSKWLNEYRAEEIVKEHWYNVLLKKKRTRFQFTFFNRMQNLGYKLEDFDNGTWSLEDSIDRLYRLKDLYYNRMINL